MACFFWTPPEVTLEGWSRPTVLVNQSNISSSCSPSMSDLEVLSKDGDSCINSPGLSAGAWRERVCEPLGWASSGSANRCTSQYSISEGLLHDLFAAYPKGAIFNASTLVDCTSQRCGHDTDARGLRHHTIILRLVQDLPEARSLLFLPMWNWKSSRWLAGALLWTCDIQRSLNKPICSMSRHTVTQLCPKRLKWTGRRRKSPNQIYCHPSATS